MSKDQQILNLYPDLSDEEDNQAKNKKTQSNTNRHINSGETRKIVKPNQVQNGQKQQKTAFKAPLLFGGKAFFPPPPPPSGSSGSSNFYNARPQFKKPQMHPAPSISSEHTQFYNGNQNSSQKHGHTQNQKAYEQIMKPQRQRRNCVYVKNLPNYYLDNERLNTFFKNEGSIKEIKTSSLDNSAIVRFVKEQHAIKFVNSKKAIFNRSFIVYGLSEKIQVPVQLVEERKFQESGKVRKPLEIEMKEWKERSQILLANKIRALLFLIKQIEEESQLQKLNEQLMASIAFKNDMVNFTRLQQFQEGKDKINNNFSWNITYETSKNAQAEKKSIIFDLQKKFGPVSEIQVSSFDYHEEKAHIKLRNQTSNGQHQLEPQDIDYYRVKISFLGIKSCWKFYYMKNLDRSNDEMEYYQTNMTVEGVQLKRIFNSGIIKKPDIQLPKTARRAEEVKPEQDNHFELVEILLSGDVKPMNDPQRVIEPEVHLQASREQQVAENTIVDKEQKE